VLAVAVVRGACNVGGEVGGGPLVGAGWMGWGRGREGPSREGDDADEEPEREGGGQCVEGIDGLLGGRKGLWCTRLGDGAEDPPEGGERR
jgi:hypothetical protein